jgi:hypothetical protein
MISLVPSSSFRVPRLINSYFETATLLSCHPATLRLHFLQILPDKPYR